MERGHGVEVTRIGTQTGIYIFILILLLLIIIIYNFMLG